jgi:hypothetical protein
VRAYDAETGAQVWRFWIVPGNPANGFENAAMEMAAKTWTGEWWKLGGGGNAWHGFTYDAELDTKERLLLRDRPAHGEAALRRALRGDELGDEGGSRHRAPRRGARARYETAPAVVTPGPFGAHDWPAMSFSPRTGLVYIPTIHQRHLYTDATVLTVGGATRGVQLEIVPAWGSPGGPVCLPRYDPARLNGSRPERCGCLERC